MHKCFGDFFVQRKRYNSNSTWKAWGFPTKNGKVVKLCRFVISMEEIKAFAYLLSCWHCLELRSIASWCHLWDVQSTSQTPWPDSLTSYRIEFCQVPRPQSFGPLGCFISASRTRQHWGSRGQWKHCWTSQGWSNTAMGYRHQNTVAPHSLELPNEIFQIHVSFSEANMEVKMTVLISS